MLTVLSKEMLDWLQEQEEDDVDGYLDVDLYIKEWAEKVKGLEKLSRILLKDNERLVDRSNKLQCLEEAGIDNVEAYSQGMMLYYERYPEKDDVL
ncbi:hypothetical protein KA005_18615 [bacterium]|nr:hypothetical protein [bacterium]